MNKIALGSVQFGIPYGISNKYGIVSIEEIKSIIRLAKSEGINTIDTAIQYGDSEQCLGEIGVDDFQVVTKLPPLPGGNIEIVKWVQNEVENSLKRLKIDQLWGLLLHRPEDLIDTNGSKLYSAIQKLKASGLTRKFGISIYNPKELDKLYNLFKLDIVQAPFNILDQRLQTSGWLEKLANDNVEIHSRSVFLQGLLLMEKGTRPKYFDKWNNLWSVWHEWLIDRELSPLKACLQFVMKYKEISKVIVGVESIAQLQEIMDVFNSKGIDPLLNIQCQDLDLINPTCWPN